MKAYLMFRDRDCVADQPLPPQADDLQRDLGLDTLFRAMSSDDPLLYQTARQTLLDPLEDVSSIRYRQEVLRDALSFPEMTRALYAIATEAIERERGIWGWISANYPEGALHRCVEVLGIYFEQLRKLRAIADEQASGFRSEGFTRLFAMLARELSDGYLASIEEHLTRLRFPNGILLSAQLGDGNRAKNYILRKTPIDSRTWIERMQDWLHGLSEEKTRTFTYEVNERDEAGLRCLSDIRSQGLRHVAAALVQSTSHLKSFFQMLRLELSFYVGALNIHRALTASGYPICIPDLLPVGSMELSAESLHDASLCLTTPERVTSNDLEAVGATLICVTGANRGGKSTFLRSVGIAQLMAQSGMFVTAASFRANLCSGVYTHFKREEDDTLRSGKFDEELLRMSAMVDWMRPHSLILFNESFAATNEREGSEIARQIVRALLESSVKVIYVTHMYDLAHTFYLAAADEARFLRAERSDDGQRTFRILPGKPLTTSYGEDLYRRIFAEAGNELASGAA